MAKWENIKNLEDGGHCVVFPLDTHYHTRPLTVQDMKWYLTRGCKVSRHCLLPGRHFYSSNPDIDPVEC